MLLSLLYEDLLVTCTLYIYVHINVHVHLDIIAQYRYTVQTSRKVHVNHNLAVISLWVEDCQHMAMHIIIGPNLPTKTKVYYIV